MLASTVISKLFIQFQDLKTSVLSKSTTYNCFYLAGRHKKSSEVNPDVGNSRSRDFPMISGLKFPIGKFYYFPNFGKFYVGS